MADMLNSHLSCLSKYSTFVLEECQGDETTSDRRDRSFPHYALRSQRRYMKGTAATVIKGVPNYWFSKMTPSPPFHIIPSSDSQSERSLSYLSARCQENGSGKATLYLNEVIMGHWEMSSGYWRADSWYYCYQVCQGYLVQQLRVEFLCRQKLSAGISWCWPHNRGGVCFPIQQFLQSSTGREE